MPVRNGRPVQDTFRLAIHGFEIIAHRSAVSDFTKKAEVDEIYVPEVMEFVKEHTGADAVASRGWVLRRSAAPAENAGSDGGGRGAAAQHRVPDVRVL